MKNAIDILLTTIIAVLLGTLITAVWFFISGEANYALLGIIWTIGALFIPTLIAVMIFSFIRSKTYPTDTTIGLYKQGLILLTILFCGILIWSILDVIFSSPLNTFYFRLQENFVSQFLGLYTCDNCYFLCNTFYMESATKV
jgi:hypothetical protein